VEVEPTSNATDLEPGKSSSTTRQAANFKYLRQTHKNAEVQNLNIVSL